MRNTTLTVLLIAMFVSPSFAAVEVGDKPKINWQTIDNQPITNKTLAGRVVIVDFWATWCGPCINELPHMLKLHRELSDKGVAFIGVSLDSSRGSLEKMVKARNIPWPQVSSFRGWKEPAAKAWGVNSIPRVFILTPQGEVYWKGHPARIDDALKEVLKEHPPQMQAELSDADRDEAVASIEAAGGYIDAADYTAALNAIAELNPDTLSDDTVRRKVGILMRKVQVQAIKDPNWMTALQADPQTKEKLSALAEKMRVVLDAERQNKSSDSDGPRPEIIAAKYKRAEEAHQQEQYVAAADGYDWLVRLAPETDEGLAAAERLVAYEADPEISRTLRVERAEREAKSLMTLANNYETAGQIDLAREHYQKVIDEYPDAERSCEAARKRLAASE